MDFALLFQHYFPMVASTFVIYLSLVILLRLFGQKQISDLNLQDFVMVLLLAETTQHAMLKEDTTITGAILALLTIMITNKLINMLFFHFPALRRRLEPTPVLVINQGRLVEDGLKKLHLNVDELQELLRENGNLSLREVKYGIMEHDGKFSIIPADDQKSGKLHDPGQESSAL